MADKNEVARKLAEAHYEVEAGITQSFRITGTAETEVRPNEPIKLLEVNRNTVPVGIMPLGFGAVPASGIPYPSIIVEVTPDEFEKIQSRALELPSGWTVSELVPRPAARGRECAPGTSGRSVMHDRRGPTSNCRDADREHCSVRGGTYAIQVPAHRVGRGGIGRYRGPRRGGG